MNDEMQEIWTEKIITLTWQNLPGGTEDNQEILRVPGILTHILTGTSLVQVQRITAFPNH